MTAKITGYLVETCYGTFVCFFYYYIFMTVVKLQPFAFGFHPPTDLEQLSPMLIIIFLSVALIKGFALISDTMNSEHQKTKPISYFPSQRH